ncbi:MAG: type II toxin-antitoxin system prevent-host-death family antitoxin [Myxococcaceae bacterium]
MSALKRKPATIGVAELKAKCTGVVQRVRRTRVPIVVTVRGEPAVEIRPIVARQPVRLGALKGTMRVLGDIVSPVDEIHYADNLDE